MIKRKILEYAKSNLVFIPNGLNLLGYLSNGSARGAIALKSQGELQLNSIISEFFPD